jgi:hypothetical protein
MAERIVLVPRDRNGKPERANIAPAPIDFMGETKRFDVQIDFSIE